MRRVTHIQAVSVVVAAGFCGALAAQSVRAPKIWDDAALADWATPVAALNVRPAHYSSAEYYAAQEHNFRTYPVYHPASEPPGYWDDLQKRAPEPLVDVTKMRTPRRLGRGRRARLPRNG